jgi:quercetin dioxygenase-like cupin family protein
MAIIHWDPSRGPATEAALRAHLEALGYRCSTYVYPPGTVFPDHTHAVDKIDAVVEGRFRISMDGQDYVLGPGDCIAVPRGRVHSAAVVGDQPVISIDAIRV